MASAAQAQSLVLTPLAEMRVRYEDDRQDDLPLAAHALTLRLRGGLQASSGRWSALAEVQGTLAAVDRYFDGLSGDARRPLASDPQDIALYRAQLRYAGKAVTLTAGRQRIALDNERFVGNSSFRDNAQTYDAVRAEIVPAARLKLDVTYAWSDRTIWGIDGRGTRQQAISGNNIFGNLSYGSPVGTVTGFAYLIDQDEAAVQGYRLSSQTYGARFAGSHGVSRAVTLTYQASYARQSGYHRNPNTYRAAYYLADATLDAHAVKIGGGYEVLGAAGGRNAGTALTSVQTPLGSRFRYQGWADQFLTTPANGVRDLYGSLGYGWKTRGPLSDLSVQLIHHDFRSDRLDQHYGSEWDALASARVGRTTLAIRYAGYHADGFAADTRKIWLQADWAL